MASNNKQDNPTSLRIKIAAGFVIIFIGLLSLEATAWLAFTSKESLSRIAQKILKPIEMKLDPYKEQATDVDGHWRLRPNYKASFDQVLAEKKEAKKWLGVKAIEQVARQHEASNGLVINAYGFRGPEIENDHLCPRVLTIGDSVTFGLGSLSYPGFMRQYFNERQVGIEIVNAGVEGYAPRNALLEVEKYKTLKPEIVLIYLGWNAIYSLDRASYSNQAISKIPWLLSRIGYVLERLFEGSTNMATNTFNRDLVPNTSDIDIDFWSNVRPKFMSDLDELIKILKLNGSEVYLISLFGLFHEDIKPTDEALSIGHLPLETNNPYVLAAMTSSYNRHLKQLATSRNVQFIDLYQWGRKNLMPLENYFFDSVHFNAKGLEKVGNFLATQISTSKKLTNVYCKK